MANVDDIPFPTAPTGAAGELATRHASEHALKLYGGWFCPFVQRAWITLCEKNIPHQYVEINPYAKEAGFLALNPRGLVPTLAVPVGGDQKVLYESHVICEYLDDAYSDETQYGRRLLPSDPFEKARARLWMDHISTKIVPAFYKFLGHSAESPYSIEDARADFHGHLRTLTEQMDPKGPWFLGEHMSLVDVSLAPWAKRLWLLDDFKEGGLGVPQGDGDEIWQRWATWFDAAVNRQSVLDTSSAKESYILSYKRRAKGAKK